MNTVIILGLTLVALLVGIRRLARRRRGPDREFDWRPAELRRAPIAFSERTFRTTVPFNLTARLDRAFSLAGELVLVELKTRHRNNAYLSDIVELSGQRVALQRETGRPVRRTGYVAVESPEAGNRKVIPVSLWSEESIHALAKRRQAILTDARIPRATSSCGLCVKCPYQDVCSESL